MKKILSFTMAAVMLLSLCTFVSFADPIGDFLDHFFPGGIDAPATAPYIRYTVNEDPEYPEAGRVKIYYDLTDEMYDYYAWIAAQDFFSDTERPWSQFDPSGEWEGGAAGYFAQVDLKFDDGKWLSEGGGWDDFSYNGEFRPDMHTGFEHWEYYGDNLAKRSSFTVLSLWDADQLNDSAETWLWSYVKAIDSPDRSDGEDFLALDLENHTLYVRYRLGSGYWNDGNEYYVHGDWSPVASIGKDGTQKPLTRPDKCDAPKLSGLDIEEDNEGYYSIYCLIEIPDNVTQAFDYYNLAENVYSDDIFDIESEIRIGDGDWHPCRFRNFFDLYGGRRDVYFEEDVEITRESQFDMRARFVCKTDESLTSPWSNVVSFNRTVTDLFWGDVNDDGKVNSKDIALYMKNAAGFPVTMNTDAADVNCDGKVNAKDISQVLKYIAGWQVVLGPEA